MINLICGFIAVILASLFIGGLAVSIWEGTGTIVFPIIAVAVLIMSYFDFFQSTRSGDGNNN